MKYRIKQRNITKNPELIQSLQEELDRFSPGDFRRLIETMTKMVRECIKKKEASTHY